MLLGLICKLHIFEEFPCNKIYLKISGKFKDLTLNSPFLNKMQLETKTKKCATCMQNVHSEIKVTNDRLMTQALLLASV